MYRLPPATLSCLHELCRSAAKWNRFPQDCSWSGSGLTLRSRIATPCRRSRSRGRPCRDCRELRIRRRGSSPLVPWKATYGKVRALYHCHPRRRIPKQCCSGCWLHYYPDRDLSQAPRSDIVELSNVIQDKRSKSSAIADARCNQGLIERFQGFLCLTQIAIKHRYVAQHRRRLVFVLQITP